MSDKVEKGSTTEQVLSGPEIPDDAVEAAAKAIQPSLWDESDPASRHAKSARADVRDEAYRALEAALPLLPASGAPADTSPAEQRSAGAIDRQVIIDALRYKLVVRDASRPDWRGELAEAELSDIADALVAALTEQPKEDDDYERTDNGDLIVDYEPQEDEK